MEFSINFFLTLPLKGRLKQVIFITLEGGHWVYSTPSQVPHNPCLKPPPEVGQLTWQAEQQTWHAGQPTQHVGWLIC